jgi:hypothetical protein
MRTEPSTKEEIIARMKAAIRANPPVRPQRPRTKAQDAEERLASAKKPTEAMAQDVTLSSNALADRLREERMAERDLANRQAVFDLAYAATKRVQQEIVRMPYYQRSATVGPRDSDAHLHQSPEDQIWGKV